jgi:transposase
MTENVVDETEIDMGKKGLVRYRRYTDEFKREAVRLAESVGGTEAAKRLGVPDGSLRNWINRSRGGKLELAERSSVAVKRTLAEVEAENVRLRRELESTQLDLEIVKKAAAYFAKESR